MVDVIIKVTEAESKRGKCQIYQDFPCGAQKVTLSLEGSFFGHIISGRKGENELILEN